MDFKPPKSLKITEERIHKNKQWPQWLAVLSASLSFFTAGICFGWSSPSLAILQSEGSDFPVSNEQASWIASFLPIGCAIGPIIGSYLSRYLGPKHSTIISVFPYLAGFVFIIFATSAEWLYVSRFLSGIAVGFGQTATPIYVAEISEDHNRGALMTFFTATMGLGALFSSSVGPYVSIQTMAEVAAIFPVLLLSSMLFFPDSPYYLMRLNKEKEAIKALKWLRRQKNETAIHEELKIIRKSTTDNLGLVECFKNLKIKPNPKAMYIINLTFFSQQICGAVVILFYQEQIYGMFNSPIAPEIAVIATSVIGNITGILSIFFVDRWGRKPLIITSALGCATATGTLGIYFFLYQRGYLEDMLYINWIPVIALNAVQIFFAFGLSPAPFSQLGEMFSSNVKEIAFCLISVITAIEGFAITKLYQIVQDDFGMPTVFWSLSILTFLTALGTIVYVPETKGKSFLEIQNILMAKKDDPKEEFKLQEATITRY